MKANTRTSYPCMNSRLFSNLFSTTADSDYFNLIINIDNFIVSMVCCRPSKWGAAVPVNCLN